ncbi:MAG: alanine--glyoxylate aminotransferase family protein [Armatimonadetes bacterium]|nr:alanine--glyoxylate aminotransferase family protein [Armatimonadota bacterium]
MTIGDLRTSDRLLLGPGPANVDPRVMRALQTPVLGHLDPEFMAVLAELMGMLRGVFETKNELTLAVSGTGSAGMEAACVTAVEPGDSALVCTAGYFGARLQEVLKRCGALVTTVEAPWGQPIDPEDVRKAAAAKKPKLIAIVHAETSTGVRHPIEDVAAIAKSHDALLLVDAVTALGGIPLRADEMGIDLVYSCTQKCLGAPPGMSPVTVSEAARNRIRARSRGNQSFYLDLEALLSYWSGGTYHHTMSATMIYALREAARMCLEEGMGSRWARHEKAGKALQAGLEAIGLKLFAPTQCRLPQLTTVETPAGVDEARVRCRLLQEFNIEIGAGLGPLRGKIWRIGVMGANAYAQPVLTLIAALEGILAGEGFGFPGGAGVAAATRAFAP